MKRIKAKKMATGGLMSMPPYIAKQDEDKQGITPYDVNTPMSARKGLPSRALDKSRTRFKDGGEAFPDLSGDGEVTQKDILIGKGVIKISAVNFENQKIKAPAMVFNDQSDVKKAYEKGLLNKDVVIVVRFQGPKANGMPELHALTPILSNIQDLGFKVALLTDGRMSGASGKVPAAIHVIPEALDNGIIGKILDGDIIDIAREDGIMVNGFVQSPGAYSYVPGYSVFNYISMAGGSTKDGSIKKIKILHGDGTSSKNPEAELNRGDVIIVERSTVNTLAGNMSILQIIASVLTIYMTYLSSQNR